VVMRCAPSATEITNPERPSTPPPRPKRMYSVNDHDVFAFENLGTRLFPSTIATSVLCCANSILVQYLVCPQFIIWL
jgi:hypothetical protein